MLNILLTIIAIGVLLCSEPGKKLLSGGIGLLVIGGILLLVIGGGRFLIANFKEIAITLSGLFILCCVVAGMIKGSTWLEQKIRKVCHYPADDKELSWYQPTPSEILFLIIITIAIILYVTLC